MSTSKFSSADILSSVRDIAETAKATDVPHAALAATRSALNIDACVWMDIDGDRAVIKAVSGLLQPESHRGTPFESTKSLIGQVMAMNRPVVMRDYLAESSTPVPQRQLLEREGVESVAGIPIPGVEQRGVLVLMSRSYRDFTPSDIQTAVGIAGIAQQFRSLRLEAERLIQADRLQGAIDGLALELLKGKTTDAALDNISGALGYTIQLGETPGEEALHPDDYLMLKHLTPIPGAEKAVLVADRDLSSDALETLARVVGLDFARQRAAAETEIRLTDQFIHGLLTAETEQLSRMWGRASLLGMDLKVPRVLISIAGSEPIERPVFDRIVREMRARTLNGQATTYEGAAFLLWPVPDKKMQEHLPRQIHEMLTRFQQHGLTAGIGPVCLTADDYPPAAREAIFARQIASLSSQGKMLMASKDLGMYRLFAHIGGIEKLRLSVLETLGPLIEADAASGSELIYTLQIFLERDRRIAETARELFIHVNTLRYRIERISKLLSADLDDPEDRFFVTLAVRLYPIVVQSSS